MGEARARQGSPPQAVSISADLAALLQERRLTVVTAQPVTTWPSDRRPSAFRLELDDGSVVKARQFPTVQRAQMVERILQMRFSGFPQPIARHGCAMLLPWVDGDVLASLDFIPLDVMHRSGANLGALHQQDVSGWPDVVVRQADQVLARLESDTTIVVAAGELEADAAAAAHELANEGVPSDASTGIIHNDFCPENMVLDASGTPVCVDNATLTFGPHDYDLARTWYRWPMSPGESEAFLRGYETHRSRASFERHFAFWSICMLTATAANRLRLGLGDRARSLDALRTILATLERGDPVGPWKSRLTEGQS